MSDFSNKKILVCGMARSGQAAALALHAQNAQVTITDTKNAIEWQHSHKFTARLGEEATDLVQDYDCIIISPGISIYAPFVQRAKSLGIPVWGEAELAYRLCPCPMLAITGTNGKTTVTTLVGEIMKKNNQKTAVAGNIGTPLTSIVSELSSDSLVVAEISSFQLETISEFRPRVSAILNITQDHIDRHRTMENYIKTKCRIFENQRQNDICVLNYDCEITRTLKTQAKTLFFTLGECPEGARDSFVFVRDGKIYFQDTPIMPLAETRVLAENALAVTAIAISAGATIDSVTAVLREFMGVEHRIEYVADIGGVEYYNDSKATNTDAAIKALGAFGDKPIILIAGGSEKGLDFLPWVRLFDGRVSHLLLIGETSDRIIKACDTAGFTDYQKMATLEQAVGYAKQMARTGSVVLLSPACASFDMFKNFEERGKLYKEYVRGVI